MHLAGTAARLIGMTRLTLWFSATAAALMLLFGYHTSLAGPATRTGTVVATGVVNPSPGATTSTAATTTVNGAAAATRYGDVQVQIVVSAGRIVKATAIAYSTGGRDGEINAYAIPTLQAQTVSKQSASLDTVSGATYTSEGYMQSLQSAIDAAHLG
jgi:uncharacterized protein with FMN-binding domain